MDTSALLAVLDRGDMNHRDAVATWGRLLADGTALNCSNYVLLELFSLLQNRLGMKAVKTFQEDIYPILDVEWINEVGHRAGVAALFAAGRKRLSLVDCISFDTMRRRGIKSAFVFDRHFAEQGFECLP